MQDLVPRLGDAPILLIGRGEVKSVARDYGFKKVVTTVQLADAMPSATPFWKNKDSSGVSSKWTSRSTLLALRFLLHID